MIVLCNGFISLVPESVWLACLTKGILTHPICFPPVQHQHTKQHTLSTVQYTHTPGTKNQPNRRFTEVSIQWISQTHLNASTIIQSVSHTSLSPWALLAHALSVLFARRPRSFLLPNPVRFSPSPVYPDGSPSSSSLAAVCQQLDRQRSSSSSSSKRSIAPGHRPAHTRHPHTLPHLCLSLLVVARLLSV